MGTATLVLLGLGLSLLQLTLGVVIGRYLADARRPRSPAMDGLELERFLGRIQQMIGRVAKDVGQHQARMAEVDQELRRTTAGGASPAAEAVLSAIASVLESNERLQKRLAAAEQRLQAQAAEIESQISEARTDPLTELPNRRAFHDELQRQLAARHRDRTPFALLMMDVDHFKSLNDRHGHPTGDHVLRELGVVLRAALRPEDLLARFGGEEFAVILPAVTREQAMLAARRLRAAVDGHGFEHDGRTLHVTASLGLAVAGAGETAAALIRRADQALYASKHAGRNCGHFHDGQFVHPFDAPSGPALRLVEPPADEPPPSPRPSEPESDDPESDDPELRLICADLRECLEEVAGESAPAARAVQPF